MTFIKTSTLIALSLISSPLALSASSQTKTTINPAIGTTSQRASLRMMKHQMAPAPLLEPMGTYVGELQEKWQFPPDHLPIAMTYDNVQFVSWNILDADTMHWVIEKNSQGLSRSQIAEEHVYIGDSDLTLRDIHVVDTILEMIAHPTHPRGILSLQECSEAFIEELQSRLPEHFKVLRGQEEATLIDLRQFEIIESKEVAGVFADSPKRSFQDITLWNQDGKTFRLINAHLPGDPTKPARFEFAHYLSNTFDPNVTTIAIGDMNFNELEMDDAMRKAFPMGSPFSVNSPYCTNISPYAFNSKAIDHFIVYSAEGIPVTLNTPDQVMTGLDQVLSLLQPSKELSDLRLQ
jgi:hypothetical protein